jgi:hypothetical protein
MRTLIVYESMYGNTHAVAEGIGSGLRPQGEVRVVPVREASADLVAWAELVVVGGPTHVHGMTRSSSRKGATDAALKPDSGLTLEPDAAGLGIREWLESIVKVDAKRAAAFDTRVDAPALLTGRASAGIANGLSRHGFTLVAKPESFLVDKQNHLVAGEADRATLWGASLARDLVPAG